MHKLIFYKRKENSQVNRDITFYLEKDIEFGNNIPVYFCLNIGISICHPSDKFIKKLGREKALESINMMQLELLSVDRDSIRGIHATYQAIYLNRYVLIVSFDIETNKITHIDLIG